MCKSAQDIPCIPLSVSQIPFLLIHTVATHSLPPTSTAAPKIKDVPLDSQKTQRQETRARAVWILSRLSPSSLSVCLLHKLRDDFVQFFLKKLTEVAFPVRVDKIPSCLVSHSVSHRTTKKERLQLWKPGTCYLNQVLKKKRGFPL